MATKTVVSDIRREKQKTLQRNLNVNELIEKCENNEIELMGITETKINMSRGVGRKVRT